MRRFGVLIVGLVSLLPTSGAPAALAAELGPLVELSAAGAHPSVTATPHGFLVAWHEDPWGENAVLVRALDADGLADAAPVRVADGVTSGSWALSRPAVASDDAGAFVVAWNDESFDIVLQRFNPARIPRGPATRGSVSERNGGGGPLVAMESGGGFVLAWEEEDEAVRVRRFQRDGTPTRPDVRATRDFEVLPEPSSSLALAGGERPAGFAVAWTRCIGVLCFDVGPSLRFFRPGGAAGPRFDWLDLPAGTPTVLTGAEGEILLVSRHDDGVGVSVQRWSADGRPLERPRVLAERGCGPADRSQRVVGLAFLPPRRLAVLRQGDRSEGERTVASHLWVDVLDARRGGRIEPCRLLGGGAGVFRFAAAATYGRRGELLVVWAEDRNEERLDGSGPVAARLLSPP